MPASRCRTDREKLVEVHDAICRAGQPDDHDFAGCAIDGIVSLRDYAEPLAKQVKLLSQVALEAIRIVHGSELGDHWSHEACGECGLGGHGALRDALTKALGPGYTKLLWGHDMNVDSESWNDALERQSREP